MIHNIFKNIAPEKWACFSVWGDDSLSIMTLCLEYFSKLPGKALLIPTGVFKLEFKTDINFINYSTIPVWNDDKSNIFLLVKEVENEIVLNYSVSEISQTTDSLWKEFDNVIFIHNLDDASDAIRFYSEVKDRLPVYPENGLILVDSKKYKKSLLLNVTQREIEKTSRIHRINFKLDSFVKDELFPVFIIFLNVLSFTRENEITSIGKELLNNGIKGIYYYLDNQCHYIGARK